MVVVSTSVDNPFRHAQNILARSNVSPYLFSTSKNRLSRLLEFFLTAVFKHLKHNALLCSQSSTLVQMKGSEKEALKDTEFFAFRHFRHHLLIFQLQMRIEVYTKIVKIIHTIVIIIGKDSFLLLLLVFVFVPVDTVSESTRAANFSYHGSILMLQHLGIDASRIRMVSEYVR